MSDFKVVFMEYGQTVFQCVREPKGFFFDLAEPICEGCEVQKAIDHHKKHADMHGHTCLLNECALHYPDAYIIKHRKRI